MLFINLGSKSSDCGELFFHTKVGQYWAPKPGNEEMRTKNNINIDFVNIVNDLIFKYLKYRKIKLKPYNL